MESIAYFIFLVLAYLYSVLIAQIISGLLIVSGKGWGKIRGVDGRFASSGVLFGFFVLDALLCSVFILLVSSLLENFLYSQFELAYGLTVEVLFITYLKVCHTFSFKVGNALRKYWKAVTIFQVTAILNIVVVLLFYLKII
jgi:hypothetical protein